MKIAPAIRLGLTALGIALVVAAFAGVLTVGAFANRPPLRIAVAARDLAQGDRLEQTAVRLVEQVLDPALARLYVQEGDLPAFLGARAVEVIRRGDPINKVKLATGGGNSRYALVLTDTNDVVMVLPVNPDVIPGRIVLGDVVNIAFFVGSEASLAMPDPTATPVAAAFGALAATPVAPTPRPTDVVTASPTPELILPVADLMLERVPVLDVAYEQVQNPSAMAGGDGAQPTYVDGAIRSIVVRVPRTHQTVLTFAAAAGRLRFAIASPLDRAADPRPRGVVDWKRMVDLLRWKEEQAISRGETLTQTLYPSYVPAARPTTPPAAPAPQALPTAAKRP